MVKITNNIVTFDVSHGAFKSVFKGMGFVKVEDETAGIDDKTGVYGDLSYKTEDEQFLQDIVEKPLSQWSKNEVKKYVDIKGIDTAGASTLAEVKELIKAYIN